jgi:uncharacterized protein (TIGR03067 family)
MKSLMCFTATAAALAALTLPGHAGGPDDLARDRKAIQGVWGVAAYDQDGKPLPAEIIRQMSVTIQADRITIRPRVVAQRLPAVKDVKFTVEEGKADEARYRLDVAKNRKVMELTQDVGSGQTRKITAAYVLADDSLTIILPLPDRKLPKKLPTGPANGMVRLVLKKS